MKTLLRHTYQIVLPIQQNTNLVLENSGNTLEKGDNKIALDRWDVTIQATTYILVKNQAIKKLAAHNSNIMKHIMYIVLTYHHRTCCNYYHAE